MAKKPNAMAYNLNSPAASLFMLARDAALEDEQMLSILSNADKKELREIVKNHNHPVQVEARRLDEEKQRKNFPTKETSILEIAGLMTLSVVMLSIFFFMLS